MRRSTLLAAWVVIVVAVAAYYEWKGGRAPLGGQTSAAAPQETYDVTFLSVGGLTDPVPVGQGGKPIALPTTALFQDAENAPVTGDGRDYVDNLNGLAPGIHLKPVLLLHGVLDADDPLRLQGGPVRSGAAKTQATVYLRSAVGVHSDLWKLTSHLSIDERNAQLRAEEQSLRANNQIQVRFTSTRSTFLAPGVGTTATQFPVGPHANPTAIQQTFTIGKSYVLESGSMSDPGRAGRNYCMLDVLFITRRT